MADHSNDMVPFSRWNFLAGSVAVINYSIEKDSQLARAVPGVLTSMQNGKSI